ncbi:MAPEG family protein [Cognatilysobacter segetis]|uniref:MAPEG family protein n=1 Tax=Cognatilysobacter segetis TaxID=2492394 RepID=UPI00138FE12B|nr:MAPEG family protein [Lysobacter segetis]
MPLVTLLVAGLHGLLLLVLLWPIVAARRGRRIGLGDGGDAALLQRIRVHANFVEYVPFALLLLALLELSGLDRAWVALLGGSLFAARVLHAIGLSRSPGVSFGRLWGTAITWGVILTASLVALVRAVVGLSGAA